MNLRELRSSDRPDDKFSFTHKGKSNEVIKRVGQSPYPMVPTLFLSSSGDHVRYSRRNTHLLTFLYFYFIIIFGQDE